MRQVFVDTSAWDALADSQDAHHELALLFRKEIADRAQLVITDYVLDELYTLLLLNIGYQGAVSFKTKLDTLIQEGVVAVVWITEPIARDAWQVFEQFNVDKKWSFTDCVSYVVMKQRNITEAFTFDHHFQQMGFTKLP
jgi:predicted nucleic acid-binding protein